MTILIDFIFLVISIGVLFLNFALSLLLGFSVGYTGYKNGNIKLGRLGAAATMLASFHVSFIVGAIVAMIFIAIIKK